MPILELQARLREIGRIRMGEKTDKGAPRRLATFRLTAPDRGVIEAAAERYGGTVTPWDSPRGTEYQVVITTTHLEVVIPPGEPIDQWRELWRAGGCIRRCDSVTERLTGQPCLCPADPKARKALAAKGEGCSDVTRLRVALPFLPDLGVWRLETHGYFAAIELAGSVELLAMAAEHGVLVPAHLRIEARTIKRPGEPRHDFTVPVLTIPDRLADMPALASGRPVVPSLAAIAAPAAAGRPALPPGPALPATSELRATPPAPAAAPAQEAAEEGSFREVAPEPAPAPAPAAGPVRCDAASPYETDSEPCAKESGHSGPHRNHDKESWT